MKKLIKTISILLFVMTISSCEDFLTKAPLNTIGTETELNQKDAVALVNAAYQPLQWPKLYNFSLWTTDIIAGNSNVGADGGLDGLETVDLSNFSASSTNKASLDIWRGANPGILRCNIALKRLPTIEMDEALRNRLMGEAYFLRAHYYFIMVRIFGDVPLKTEPLDAGSNLNQARTPKAQVYEQIIADTKKAIEMLPVKSSYSTTDLGRACKEAAQTQLAKVYLTLETNYQDVVDLCQSIQDQGYDLATMDYANNFKYSTNNGPESIFEIQYIGKSVYDFWNNLNQASWLSTYMGPRNSGWVGGGGWGWQHVKQEFVDSYEAGDLRKDVTILYKGCPQFNGKDYDPSWSLTGYNVRKFLVPKDKYDWDSNPSNFVVYRFADVLLMKAEALNELGSTQLAQTPLNIVRTRAGLPNITTTDKETMKDAIIHERRMELAFEGHRWFDLIRIDNGDYAIKFFKSIGKANVTKDRLLYPIPQDEIDANPNMTQNPTY